MIRFSIILILLGLAHISSGQVMVKFFNIKKSNYAGSYPHSFVSYKGKVYFAAFDDDHGRELHVSDGSSVKVVADLVPGSSSGMWGVGTYSDNYYNYTCVIGELLYYASEDVSLGNRVFEYDGIAQPKIVSSLPNTNHISQLTNLNGKLYFRFNTQTSPSTSEIAVYNPADGTTKIISKGNLWHVPKSPLFAWKNKLFMCAGDSSSGEELYSYDPITNKFDLVAETYPGKDGAELTYFDTLNERLYFMANTNSKLKERQLAEYDGTQINILTENINMTGAHIFGRTKHKAYGIHNGNIYFTAYQSGWPYRYAYNQTASTISIIDTVNAAPPADHANLWYKSYKNKLYYNDGYFGTPQIFLNDFNTPAVDLHYQQPNLPFSHLLFSYSHEHDGYLYCPANNTIPLDYELVVLYDSTLSVATHPQTYISATAYPNPVTQDAQIDIKLNNAETIAVQLIDINGKLVYSQEAKIFSTGNHTINLPMKELSTGMYVYKLTDEQGLLLHSGKLLKQ